eukprot:SAG31_NODE_1851_length_7077_cov_2.680854_8_plen_118_part_00
MLGTRRAPSTVRGTRMRSAKINAAREAKEAEQKAKARAANARSRKKKTRSPQKKRGWHDPTAEHLLSPAVRRAQSLLGASSHADALVHAAAPADAVTIEFTSARNLGLEWGKFDHIC